MEWVESLCVRVDGLLTDFYNKNEKEDLLHFTEELSEYVNG